MCIQGVARQLQGEKQDGEVRINRYLTIRRRLRIALFDWRECRTCWGWWTFEKERPGASVEVDLQRVEGTQQQRIVTMAAP